ncbi:MAG: hypothetical protein ABJI60_15285 [Kangiellaceae bacterium]
MSIFYQLKLSLFEAIASLRFFNRKALSWGVIYSLATIVIFGLFVWFLFNYQVPIKAALLDYLFPKSWQSLSEQLANFLFESQTKIVLGNMILSGSLVLASITLFPVKEKYSSEFEKTLKHNNGQTSEFPLYMQALEEVKLFLLYLTAQSVILWIGYYPFVWTTIISNTLSFVFLFATFGLDFIAPTLQRHRVTYSLMIKFLLQHPLIALSFGTLFSLPLVLISPYIFSIPELSFIEITGFLLFLNIIFLVLAVPAGTFIASKLLPEVRQTEPAKRRNVRASYVMMTVLLLSTLFLHSQLVVSLHHKSQLLKAEYDLDWSSIGFDLPSFSELSSGKALSNFSMDIVINNPTQFDIIIEPSELYIEQKENLIAKLNINGFALASGENKRITLNMDSDSDLSKLSEFGELTKDWNIDMYIDVWPGIPFMLNVFKSE